MYRFRRPLTFLIFTLFPVLSPFPIRPLAISSSPLRHLSFLLLPVPSLPSRPLPSSPLPSHLHRLSVLSLMPIPSQISS